MWECPLLLELQQHPVAAGSRSTRELPVKYTTASMDLCPPRPTALGAQIREASLTPNSGSYELLNVSGPSTAADGGAPSGEAGEADRLHFFCISPDAPTNPSLYWIGNYNSETRKFDMEHAQGPFRLDLGDTIYAPNIMTDARGRHLLWGWIQERRRVASGYSYSGCLSSPRVLWNRNGRLVQEPLPEVEQLRSGVCWREQHVRLPQDQPVPLQGVSGMALDIHVKLQRGSAAAAGLILRSWNTEGSGVLLLDWERSQLEMAWEGMDPVTMQYSLEAETARRVGGPVQLPLEGQPVGLRLLLDHSCLEVFLDTGEALTTRCYRGKPPQDTDCGIDLIALGGSAVALEVEVHEMLSIWSAPSALPLLDRSGMPSSSASMDDAVLFPAEQSPQLIPSFDATVQLSI